MDGTHGSSAALSTGVLEFVAKSAGRTTEAPTRHTPKAAWTVWADEEAPSGLHMLTKGKKKSILNPWFVEINLKLSHLYLKLLISI
jgi:hypothetical protein